MSALHRFEDGQEKKGRSAERLETLRALERQVLWLSTWTVHHANAIRPKRDGLKVGGHQSSSASIVSLMTALYFHALRPEDRVAVKPHASPVFHAIHYLLGRQSLDQLINFRAFGGAQSYPSRTKDAVEVDFSTGSVGLGLAATLFASLVQDIVLARDLLPAGRRPGRMVALMGDVAASPVIGRPDRRSRVKAARARAFQDDGVHSSGRARTAFHVTRIDDCISFSRYRALPG